MSAPNESTNYPTPSAVSNGKTPAHSRGSGLVKVEPARVEDLQPSYAQTLKHNEDNPDAHGWYASFSKLIGPAMNRHCA